MGSRYDAKQGIDGIVTLTNDPLAIDNIRKIKAGDRVVCNDDGNNSSGNILIGNTGRFSGRYSGIK